MPPFRNVHLLVENLVAAIDPYLDLPFALFGHSMGGLIIFELARALRTTKKPGPSHFFVSGCRAPNRPERPFKLHLLPDDIFVNELRERYQGIPDVVMNDPDLLQMFLQILRADLELVETYHHSAAEPFDFPISAFGGVEDSEIGHEDVEAWRHQTSSTFRLHMLPGGHFFINTARSVLLRMLNQELMAHLGGADGHIRPRMT
jgi:surfactin synthase thioesterase subunit